MRYDLNLLPVFVALMEERNVTRAAERLGITQPALSNALTRLRTSCATRSSSASATACSRRQMAEELAPVIAAALARIDEVILRPAGIRPGEGGATVHHRAEQLCRVRAGAAIVARLRERAPGIRLRLTPYGTDLAETGVISGATAMVLGRIVDPPDNLVVQHLMDDGLACVVRADHPDVTKACRGSSTNGSGT